MQSRFYAGIDCDTDIQGRVLRLALKIQSDQRKGDSTVSMPRMTSLALDSVLICRERALHEHCLLAPYLVALIDYALG
ncbi:hypothetical protein GCM10011613_31080 [Cellvibrio zantedeschiae]|uniref:Uncharacterized protein n=1 Tax=Cellvibrio zantedeschiae TaxID=1237077 RepID=A0ABQ3B7V0_9GAMM|nr:hypothetical protein GCM10011613_31080 [Cellvibrio zantedeschiae]